MDKRSLISTHGKFKRCRSGNYPDLRQVLYLEQLSRSSVMSSGPYDRNVDKLYSETPTRHHASFCMSENHDMHISGNKSRSLHLPTEQPFPQAS
jgi:hypothetical protein